MHSCKPVNVPAHPDNFWIDSEPTRRETEKNEFSINELASEFALTHRALRFYESRGLLSPRREGRRRFFTRADRDRLAIVLKGKKLGFTLSEISQMIDAQAGRATEHGLKLTAEKCVEQIAHFEKQITDAEDALKELRRIQLMFGGQFKA